MNSLEAKAKFSANLMQSPDQSAFSTTILYMVYKTIEANDNITLNQLRFVLNAEYMLREETIEAAVASLTSKSLFDCVGRWQPRRSKQTAVEKQDSGAARVHLRVHKECLEFNTWLASTLKSNPELVVFAAPLFKRHGQGLNREAVAT